MSEILLNEVLMPKDLYFLFLEDTVIFQRKMIDSLVAMGFRGTVTVTDTVAKAIKILAERKPGFILSDWNLPDGKGVNFLRHVRLNTDLDDVPFVMVTTMDDISDILNAVSLGADGYVVKPWESDDLTEKISFAYAKRKGLA